MTLGEMLEVMGRHAKSSVVNLEPRHVAEWADVVRAAEAAHEEVLAETQRQVSDLVRQVLELRKVLEESEGTLCRVCGVRHTHDCPTDARESDGARIVDVSEASHG